MIITRKIQIFVCEDNQDLRKEYYHKLYANRDVAVKVANMAVSHMFVLDNTMPYLSEESRKTIEFLGAKGTPASRNNAPYVVASEAFKGQADMSMISSVLQNVEKMYKDDKKQKGGMWERSLRSYKNSLPVPYKRNSFVNLRFEKYINGEGREVEGCFFSLMKIPFQMIFGKDRSGNRLIVKRILEQERFDATSGSEGSPTGYKMCTSSIAFEKKFDKMKDKKVTKMFLYLCIDIPKKDVKLDPKKFIFAYLGINHPIQCLINAQCDDISSKEARWFDIGNAEEFLYRRTQIQAALHRCQQNCTYNKVGKGRKRKLQAIERFEEKEKHYVDTKLHLYSRMLVNLAVAHGCGTICLVHQKPREDEAKKENQKGNPLLLRNWSYYGLKTKIDYKCKMVGIKMKELGKKKGASGDDDDDDDQ